MNVHREIAWKNKLHKESCIETERFVQTLHREIISLCKKAQRQIRYSRGSSTRYTVKCNKIKYKNISYIRYQFHFIDSKSIHIRFSDHPFSHVIVTGTQRTATYTRGSTSVLNGIEISHSNSVYSENSDSHSISIWYEEILSLYRLNSKNLLYSIWILYTVV